VTPLASGPAIQNFDFVPVQISFEKVERRQLSLASPKTVILSIRSKFDEGKISDESQGFRKQL
jgi:hypothetical protein